MVAIDIGEEVLEHTAGGARGGDELHHLVAAVGGIFFPCFLVLRHGLVRGLHDAFLYAGGSVDAQIGKSLLELLELVQELRFADALGL